jgi:hypothetical protein
MAKLASCLVGPAVAPRRRSRTLARKTVPAKATIYIALYMRSARGASVGNVLFAGSELSVLRQVTFALART